MVDAELGLTVVFNGCIYNYRELRDELRGPRLPVLLHLRHRGDRQGLPPRGAPTASTTSSGMFAFAIVERDSGRLVLARDRLGIKPLYLAETAGPAAVRLHPAGAAGRRRRRHLHRPGRAAPLHDASTRVVPAPRTILTGVRKLPPATVRVVEPDGTRRDHVYWDPPFTRRPERAGLVRAGLAGRAARRAAHARSSGGWSPTCRSACCCPAASTPA